MFKENSLGVSWPEWINVKYLTLCRFHVSFSFHLKVYGYTRTCSLHLRQWLLSPDSWYGPIKGWCEQLIEAHRKHCVRYWRHCSRHKLCGKHCFNTSYPVRGLIDSCRQVIISLTYQHSAVCFVPLTIGSQWNDSKSKVFTRYTSPKEDLNEHYASRPFLLLLQVPQSKVAHPWTKWWQLPSINRRLHRLDHKGPPPPSDGRLFHLTYHRADKSRIRVMDSGKIK